jgi:hypothetical protein
MNKLYYRRAYHRERLKHDLCNSGFLAVQFVRIIRKVLRIYDAHLDAPSRWGFSVIKNLQR